MASALKTLIVLLMVSGVFSGLALISQIESFDSAEIYKVKIWKHVNKAKEKVCWDKSCAKNQYDK